MQSIGINQTPNSFSQTINTQKKNTILLPACQSLIFHPLSLQYNFYNQVI